MSRHDVMLAMPTILKYDFETMTRGAPGQWQEAPKPEPKVFVSLNLKEAAKRI